MESKKIRDLFLNFFEGKGHKIVKSSSLVPIDDPTLLFTNAGMVQFKKFWATDIPLPYTRATSCQKCLRAGGKDSDLEKIGESDKHHTFFEMLGNFSFGDYFKKEAIEWAFEFVIEKLKIPEEKIWISYFKDDLETKQIWKEFLPEEKLIPLGEKDNFWGPAGDTGPCGPCTEIYFDFGKEKGCGREECKPGCDCDRFLEFWNLVFPQFDKQLDGTFLPLKRRGVDTGMGLERISRILQGVESNYDTDIFLPIIEDLERISSLSYKENKKNFRIIADHIRGIIFAIGDGVLPSNEGRGYVLRRIIRRACLSGLDIGVKGPFLYNLVETVVKKMGDEYPEILENKRLIEKVIHEEEERFQYLISSSRKIFFDIVKKEKELNGEIVFKLYDTYGIPKDIISELADKYGKSVNWEDFEKIMEKQKELSRKKSQIGFKKKEIKVADKIIESEFTGYEKLFDKGNIVGIFENENNLFLFVFNKTPFYPEKGGQIGDRGRIYNESIEFEVIDTQIDEKGLIYHIGKILKGSLNEIQIGDEFNLSVDEEFRKRVSINHTATHLLHYALRQVIGKETRQAGSYVGDDRLRFDFICFKEINDEIIEKVEEVVLEKILNKEKVRVDIMDLNKAIELGSIALFTEKYGEKVRVVSIGDFHREVCGGTHLRNTGDIFIFHILDFTTIGKNLKRIEAITYKKCFEYYNSIEKILNNITSIVKTEKHQIEDKIKKLIENNREKDRIINHYVSILIDKITLEMAQNYDVIVKNGETIKVFVGSVEFNERDYLAKISDRLTEKEESSIVFIFGKEGRKKPFVLKIGNKIINRISAIKTVQKLSKYIKGGGNEKFVSGVLEENINLKVFLEEFKKLIYQEF